MSFYPIDPPAPANIIIMDPGPCPGGKWEKVADWPAEVPEHTGEFFTVSGYDPTEKDAFGERGMIQVIMIDGQVVGIVHGPKDGPGLRWVCVEQRP